MTSEILDRLPPQNLDAERAVLGSILLHSRVLDDIAPLLTPGDFYAESHRLVYETMLTLYTSHRRVDHLCLEAELKSNGLFEKVGGRAYVMEIVTAVPVYQNAEYYARLVATESRFRKIIHASTEVLRKAYDHVDSSEDLATEAIKLLDAAGSVIGDGEPIPMATAVLAAMDHIDEVRRRKTGTGLLTGLLDFDEQYGGLFPGELTILAARPGVGKSAICAQIGQHVAERKRMVYFASLEMSSTQLASRTLCSEANVSGMRLRTGKLTDDDYARFVEPSNSIAARPLWLHSDSALTIAKIRRACIRLKPKGLALVIVDYLQIIEARDRRMNRYEQIGEITRGLKALACELDVPVLVPAQLARQAETESRPRLSHLRESGDIEQAADNVLFLCRPITWSVDNQEIDGEPHPSQAGLIIEKQRNGTTGTIPLVWDAPRTRFDCRDRPVVTHSEFDRYSTDGGFG